MWHRSLGLFLNSPFTRGGVRVKGGSCLAAGAGGQPPHGRYIIHRMRKPSRSGTHSRRPGVAQPEEAHLSSRQPSCAQLPDQLCSGQWPGHARCSTQHGGSDHRRPSNVETGTPRNPPVPFQNTTRRQQTQSRVESYVPLSTRVAWAAKPAPTQVVDTTTHHVPLKLAQLAPSPCSPGPSLKLRFPHTLPAVYMCIKIFFVACAGGAGARASSPSAPSRLLLLL